MIKWDQGTCVEPTCTVDKVMNIFYKMSILGFENFLELFEHLLTQVRLLRPIPSTRSV